MRTRINDEGIEHLTEKFLPTLKDNLYADAFQLFGATTGEMLACYAQEKRPFTTAGVLVADTRTATDSTAQTKNKDAEWCSVEDLQALCVQKRCAKMAVLNLSVFP